jgi:Flp pilus assembly protein TadG
MTYPDIAGGLRRLAARLLKDRAANVTVTFALATIPMMGFVGAAVDYSRANSVKAAMQAAADSTALMLSKDAATITGAQLQTKANDTFKALLNRPEARHLQVAARYTEDGGSAVLVNASSRVDTDFMSIMGFSQLAVAVESQVKWGNARLRVALALDVTGSMSSAGKLNAMKTAAKGFLCQLRSAASKDGDVYVSIVPFNKDVNLGSDFRNSTAIRWDLWDDELGECSISGGGGSKGKGKGKGGGSGGDYDNRRDCERAGGTWTVDKSAWNGCVADRDQDYDTNNTAASASIVATQYPA